MDGGLPLRLVEEIATYGQEFMLCVGGKTGGSHRGRAWQGSRVTATRRPASISLIPPAPGLVSSHQIMRQ